jgi:hypothetical protein
MRLRELCRAIRIDDVARLPLAGSNYFTDISNLNLFDLAQLTLQYVVTYMYLMREYYCYHDDVDSYRDLKRREAEAGSQNQAESPLDMLAASATSLTFLRFMSVMRGSTSTRADHACTLS